MHCKYCFKIKPTQAAINRHISHSVLCNKAWRRELTSRGALTALADVSGGTERATYSGDDASDIEMEGPGDSFEPESYQPPTPPEILLPEPGPVPQRRRNVEVEEVDNVDDPHSKTRWAQSYPGKVATPIKQGRTQFHVWKDMQAAEGKSEWAPFDNQEEWDLAQWLMKNVGQKSIDEYLKLPIVSSCHGAR